MLRALFWMLAAAALAAAVLLVPIDGQPLWGRFGGDKAVAWARALLQPKHAAKKKVAAAKKPAAPAPARGKPADKPQETISRDDRAALDALVAGQAQSR